MHSSAGVYPVELMYMYSRHPRNDSLSQPPTAYAPRECGETLHSKLAELTPYNDYYILGYILLVPLFIQLLDKPVNQRLIMITFFFGECFI